MKDKTVILLGLFLLMPCTLHAGKAEAKTVRYEYYPGGGVKLEIPMKGEVMDGKVKFFDEAGVLREEGVYQDGLVKGPVQTYDASGHLERRIIFENNALKVIQRFDAKGNLLDGDEEVSIEDYQKLMEAAGAVKFQEPQE
ncbi:MAG: hypothetical protein H6757_06335 [Candidatus Omnitrophica bacterium]|nr:hypothetical protein [Candidatus Omnitrophota bacterium]